MKKSSLSSYLTMPVAALAVGFCILCGCVPQELGFRPNELYVASLSRESNDEEVAKIAVAVQAQVDHLLGTPDSPKWPSEIQSPFDLEKVTRASGPVGRNEAKIERGLFRKHCVTCHGATGDGRGPASALLAPYPRDFRRGSFKFKSTAIGKKPTHADLVRTLENGLPGTAMPAFVTLNQSKEFAEDIDALAHYVRFLSIRGEIERRLIAATINEENSNELIMQIVSKVSESWTTAEASSIQAPTWNRPNSSEEHWAAIDRGKAIFLSELTACSKCHGKEANGLGTSQDFDDWTKDWTIRAGIDPAKKAEWKPMKKFGALKPVIDSPRNLNIGAFRGGSTRQDIYLRIVLGIEGSPMPAIAREENGNPGSTEEGIRDLVEYVYSLSRTEEQSTLIQDSRANHAQSH